MVITTIDHYNIIKKHVERMIKNMASLTDLVSLALSAAAKLTPEEVSTQLKAYGLAVDGLSAAASENPEAAVAGVFVGAASVAATIPLTATVVTTIVGVT